MVFVKEKFPIMLDRPETPRIVIGLMYCFLAFFSLPFFMLLLMQGGFEDEGIISGIEIAYHVINFLVLSGYLRII